MPQLKATCFCHIISENINLCEVFLWLFFQLRSSILFSSEVLSPFSIFLLCPFFSPWSSAACSAQGAGCGPVEQHEMPLRILKPNRVKLNSYFPFFSAISSNSLFSFHLHLLSYVYLHVCPCREEKSFSWFRERGRMRLLLSTSAIILLVCCFV